MCLLCGLWCIQFAGEGRASDQRETAVVRAVRKARQSVVNIHGRKSVPTEEARFSQGDRQVNGMGTGIVIDDRGYVLTNFHVVDGVSRIQVTLDDQRTVVGQLVNHDAGTDLAVIKIPQMDSLRVIDIGTSSSLMLGEPVIAIGNAYGYNHTVSDGIISSLRRDVHVSEAQNYHDVIQTNASINPGNSGGPLLNIDGEMVGIIVAVRVGAQGIGFAIPVDSAMDIAARLLAAEHVSGLTHGVEGRAEFSDQGTTFVVETVREGSPAELAGLQPGDVIETANSIQVQRGLDLERALLGVGDGDEIDVAVRRADASLSLRMALHKETRSAAPAAVDERGWQTLGLRLAPVPKSAFRPQSSRYRGGLKVLAVRPGSPAEKQGIQRGDILIGMHKWETVSLDNVSYILDNAEVSENQPLKFYILRNQEPLYGYLRVASGSN